MIFDEQMRKIIYGDLTLKEITLLSKKDQEDLDGPWEVFERAQKLSDSGAHQEASRLLAELCSETSDSRITLWAAKALRDRGHKPGGPAAIIAQGVVVEVPMEGGKDVMAVYRDGTVRFFSFADSAIFYEGGNDPTCDRLCQQIIATADKVAATSTGAPFAEDDKHPRVTVLTISGNITAGNSSPTRELMQGATQLLSHLMRMTRKKP